MKAQPIQEVAAVIDSKSYPHDRFVSHAHSFVRNVRLTIDMLTQRGVFGVDELALAGEIYNNCDEIITLCETYQQEKTAQQQGKGDLANIDYNEFYILVNDAARNFTPLLTTVLERPKRGIMPAELKPLGDMFNTSLELVQMADHFFSDQAAQMQFDNAIDKALASVEKN